MFVYCSCLDLKVEFTPSQAHYNKNETPACRLGARTILENIDLQRRIVFIPQAKAGAREQPITKNLAEYLAEQIKTTGPGDKSGCYLSVVLNAATSNGRNAPSGKW